MSIHPSGTLIANRYEVVQGPREKPSLAGGMGLVYLCIDHAENGRPVALKTFRPELLPDRAARDRFLREGTTWVQLGKHPHIVRCHQVFKADIGPEVFFVLELVAAAEGKRDASLRSWLIPSKPLSVEQALLFALHIARGMKHATEKIPGLVHRDLKPENVLVGRDGIAKVTDFGLVSAMQEASGTLRAENGKENEKDNLGRTQLTQGIVGTPLYMAPEQWAGAELDARTDIYAFGCILYEMSTRKFAVFGKNVRELEEAHRSGRIGEIPLNLPSNLAKLLHQCIAVNREERYLNWIEVETEVTGVYKTVTGNDAPRPIDDSQNTHAERVAAGWSYNTIGLSYADIGKVDVARKYLEQVLTIALVEKERSLEAVGLGNLGNAYFRLGDSRRAIEFHEKSLAISCKIGDRYIEGMALGSLGNAYYRLGDLRRAIDLYEKYLIVAREIGDRQAESLALGNLGIAYGQLGNPHRAIKFQKKRLAIAREIGDRYGEGEALGNLGNHFLQLGDSSRAIKFYEKRLAIAQEIGDRRGEEAVLGNLGLAHGQLGNPSRAIEFFEKRLTITREIGDRYREGQVLGNLGNAYLELGDHHRAIEFQQKSLAIAHEVSDRHGEGNALANLGNIYFDLRDLCRAIEFFEKHLFIAREIGEVIGTAQANFNLAVALMEQGRLSGAYDHAEYAKQIFTEVGHKDHTAIAQKLANDIQIQLSKST